jgi:glycosyltransferase involved in cell wall biosynthesis
MSHPSSPLISVVVPCYNEEGNIDVLYQKLQETLQIYSAHGAEILFIDDGSSDNTWNEISTICSKDKHSVGLRLSRNFGHQVALTCGIEHATGQRVLIIDADLQDPPELLHDMMTKMDAGYDVVYGHRVQRQGESFFKRLSAWAFYRFLNKLSEVPIPKDVGDFRLMSRRVVDALKQMPERIRFTRGMVSWLGFKQVAIDYTRAPRYGGKSHYSLRSMLRLATAGLTSFSTQPLRFALWLGIGLTMLSSVTLACALLDWMLTGNHHNYIMLVSAFLFFQGIQWIMLGIIGSYIGIILRETKIRPLYLLDEHLNKK